MSFGEFVEKCLELVEPKQLSAMNCCFCNKSWQEVNLVKVGDKFLCLDCLNKNNDKPQ